ncbi:hypothetical protein BDV11DRAFT_198741 [Aspergillus similis]
MNSLLIRDLDEREVPPHQVAIVKPQRPLPDSRHPFVLQRKLGSSNPYLTVAKQLSRSDCQDRGEKEVENKYKIQAIYNDLDVFHTRGKSRIPRG